MIPTTSDALLAYQRWQIARAIRDGKYRSIDDIAALVGFDPLPALSGETRGQKNFERAGTRWRLKKKAVAQMERHENRERISGPPIPWRPKKQDALKRFTYRRRQFGQ